MRATAPRRLEGPDVARRLDSPQRGVDELVRGVSGPLFATDDLRSAVASFLADGPGKATYTGR